MRSTRGKVGTVALLTLSTMFLSALPAMASSVTETVADGLDRAYASNLYSPQNGYEAVIKLCDEEPDGDTVYGEFRTHNGTLYTLTDVAWGDCAWGYPKGEGNQIYAFRIREDGDPWSAWKSISKAPR
ncbi:hypothetical protein GCM10022247_72430 [Allokutzneria multivorans]|uniref:Uncharacterized protein n=1 Tax=Allokutzneria multivorans TaxID=1142134 RepID=A0ABP7U546_9PSEU